MKRNTLTLLYLACITLSSCSDSSTSSSIESVDCQSIDLQTSNENCGTCGNICGKNQTCHAGICECDSGYSDCDNDGVCETDSGSCDVSQNCPEGKCQCEAGFSDCDNNGTCETEGECICRKGDTKPCYDGEPGTENVGNCHGGLYHCIVNEDIGADWDYECVGQVAPLLYPICNPSNAKGDSDCNGIPDYQQDEDNDGYFACTEIGMPSDCCDSKHACSNPEKVNPGKAADCKGNNIDDDCDGQIDEDDVSCSSGPTTTSCLIEDHSCGNSIADSISDSQWASQVSSGQAALQLAKSMDMCLEIVSKSDNKSGIIEYSLSRSTSSGPSNIQDVDFKIDPAQVAVINGMADQNGKILIPARVGNNFAMLSSGTAGDARNVLNEDTSFTSIGGSKEAVPDVYLKQHDGRLVSHRKCTSAAQETDIHDSVVLHFKLRAPESARGFSFDFRFFSREYPYYLCTSFNDFFMTIVTDETGKPFIDTDNDGDISDEDGNVSFDKFGNAVSVNNAFFTSCIAPSCQDKEAMQSIKTDGCPGIFDCKSNHCGTCEDGISDVYAYIRNPYSGKGSSKTEDNRGGGTTWLTTTVPIPGGKVFNLDFYIWDTRDTIFDSSVILDNFQWRCDQTSTGTDFADDPTHIN